MKTGKRLGFIALLMASLTMLFAGTLYLAGWVIAQRLETAPRLKVINQSGEDLQELILEGSGFREKLGDLPAGESRIVTVHPNGESGVRLSFLAKGQPFTSDSQGYFESYGGYRVVVWIDRDFQVDARTALFLLP
jgi:hypothetical protein